MRLAPVGSVLCSHGHPSHVCPLTFQGYEGLVEGGENIKQANWLSVSNIIQLVSLGPSLL